LFWKLDCIKWFEAKLLRILFNRILLELSRLFWFSFRDLRSRLCFNFDLLLDNLFWFLNQTRYFMSYRFPYFEFFLNIVRWFKWSLLSVFSFIKRFISIWSIWVGNSCFIISKIKFSSLRLNWSYLLFIHAIYLVKFVFQYF